MKLLKIAVNESVEGATRRACGVWWVRRLPCSWLRGDEICSVRRVPTDA